MTRWIILILLALVLGSITTVAIALACARWSRPTTFSMGGRSIKNPDADSLEMEWGAASDFARWLFVEEFEIDPADIDSSPRHRGRFHALERRNPHHHPDMGFEAASDGILIAGRGVLWIYNQKTPIGSTLEITGAINPARYEMGEKQYGWPLLCLSSGDHWRGVWLSSPGTVRSWFGVWADVSERYHRRPSSGDDRVLDRPRVILWPGFIANTLFFSAPWLLGMIGIAGARKSLRRRRGQCPVCVYDLRGDFARGCPECGWGREGADTHEGTETRNK